MAHSVSFRARCSLLLALWLLALMAGGAAAKYPVQPTSQTRLVDIGPPGDSKPYILLSSEPTRILLKGPGEITGYLKVHFKDGETGTKLARIRQEGVPGVQKVLDFELKAPKEDGGGISRGRKVSLTLPEGDFQMDLTGLAQDGGFVYLILYYEGPPQPEPGSFVIVADEAVEEKQGKSWRDDVRLWGWKVRTSVSLKTAYVDNAFKYSSAFVDIYLSGSKPEAYQVDSVDDLLITPRFDFELRRRLIPLGETRLGFRYARQEFWENPILFNHEVRFIVRQATGRGKSLEFFYSYSPSKYLRQLNDRPPNVSDNVPVVGEEFRLTRNNFVLNYRQTFNRTFSGKLSLVRGLYYYNRPHLENDLFSWELRGTLYWNMSRQWQLTAEYGYKAGDARAADLADESKEESTASDGNHERDFYQAALRWRPKTKALFFQQFAIRGQYRVSYFTVNVPLEEDPYHVGRKDNEYLYSVTANRNLSRNLSMDMGFDYAERQVESPWAGDISEDKDYIVRTFSLGLNYRIF